MNDKLNSAFMDDPEFQSLMVDCMEALHRGESIDRDALREKFPKYAGDLDQYLDVMNVLDQFAGGLPQLKSSGDLFSPYGATITPHTANSDFESGDTIRYIGEYEVLEEIARGGMGVVFKARQQTLKRIVALKMILSGRLADGAEIDRFRREAQAASRLKHPNIVAVHEIGEHEGRHYFTMDYVPGPSLAEEIRDESVAPRDAAKLVKTVAEAVHFAHQAGTLHRDLKPANILLTSDDVPHVTDFGLAKILEEVDDESRAELTASGQILGTPSYMSPEQAAGRQNLVGPASDIYSLGAILYACLTGRAPFVADTPIDTLMQVIHKESVPPRQLNPAVPQDLETICLKCLNKEPHKRYGTAQELADDLERFLKGRPVHARPVGRVARTWRWTKRNPMVATLLVLAAMSLVTGTAVSSYFAVVADRRADAEAFERNRADNQAEKYRLAVIETNRALGKEKQALGEVKNERDLANRRLEKLSRAMYASQLDEVYDLWKINSVDASRRLADEKTCPPSLRDFSWRYLKTLTDWTLTKWKLDTPPPDQTKTITGRFQVPFVNRTHVGILHSQFGTPFALIEVPKEESFSVVAYSRDAQLIAAASEGIITVWETSTRQVIHEFEQNSDVTCLQFTDAPHRLVAGGNGLSIWEISTGELMKRLGEGTHEITHLSVSSDGTRMLTETVQGIIELWDSTLNEPVKTLSGNEKQVSRFEIAPNARHFAICGQESLRIGRTETGEVAWKLDQPVRNDEKWRLAIFSDDSRFVVTSGGVHHAATFWNTKSGDQLLVHKALGFAKDSIFIDNGRGMISRNQRGRAILRQLPPPEGYLPIETPAFQDHTVYGQQTVVSPDGRLIAVAAGEKQIQIVRIQTQQVIQTIEGAHVNALAWSSHGNKLAGVMETGEVVVWNPTTGDVLHHRTNPSTLGRGLIFLPGDQRLALPIGGDGMMIWNLQTGETIEKRFGRYPLYSLAVSPDGRYLAAGTGFFPIQWPSPRSIRGKGRVAGKISIWDLSTLEQVALLDGHKQFGINDLAFSPDSRTLASASNNVIFWDVATWMQRDAISWLSSDLRSVWSVDFSPDGKTLATASDDGSLRLWDPITGVQRLALIEAIPVLRGGGLATNVEFSSDGRWLVATGHGSRIVLWPASAADSDQDDSSGGD